MGPNPQSTSATRSPDRTRKPPSTSSRCSPSAVRNCRWGSHASGAIEKKSVSVIGMRATPSWTGSTSISPTRTAGDATARAAGRGGGRTAARRHPPRRVRDRRRRRVGPVRRASLALDDEVVGAAVAVPRGRGRVERLRLGGPPRLVVAVIAGLGSVAVPVRRPRRCRGVELARLLLRGRQGQEQLAPRAPVGDAGLLAVLGDLDGRAAAGARLGVAAVDGHAPGDAGHGDPVRPVEVGAQQAAGLGQQRESLLGEQGTDRGERVQLAEPRAPRTCRRCRRRRRSAGRAAPRPPWSRARPGGRCGPRTRRGRRRAGTGRVRGWRAGGSAGTPWPGRCAPPAPRSRPPASPAPR